MATQSPYLWLEGLLQNLPRLPPLQPPVWALDEVQHRIVLLLNHILQQEVEAKRRLTKQEGRVVLVQWRTLTLKLRVTPAGLLELGAAQAQPDLLLTLTEESPMALAQSALSGDKPTVRIEGDVQLAAEVNWLVDHVRWDLEEELSRVMGDVPAHNLAQVARHMTMVLHQFVAKVTNDAQSKAQS